MSEGNYLKQKTATIASAAALSDVVRIKNTNVVGLVLPAAWTAAGIGFHVSYDETTYVQLTAPDYTASPPYGLDEYEILAADVPTAEAVMIALDPSVFLGAVSLKIQSQTAGSAVNQGAERVLYVMTRNMMV